MYGAMTPADESFLHAQSISAVIPEYDVVWLFVQESQRRMEVDPPPVVQLVTLAFFGGLGTFGLAVETSSQASRRASAGAGVAEPSVRNRRKEMSWYG